MRVIVYGFTNTADLSLPTRYLATYTSAYVGFAYCTTTGTDPTSAITNTEAHRCAPPIHKRYATHASPIHKSQRVSV